MAKDLLLEIGTEEIPARFIEPALNQMRDLLGKALSEGDLTFGAVKTYGTPRRLAILVERVAEQQPDRSQEVKGPAKKAAYDEQGQPSKALLGFCRGQGVALDDLFEKELKGVPYMYANKEIKGQPAQAVLPGMLEELIKKIYFPKPMRWGYGEMRFARPIHWLVALLGDTVLPLSIAGIQSGNLSRGHRFLGSQAVVISQPSAYVEALRQESVLVDPQERQALIWQQAQAAAASCGGQLQQDADLLKEITYLLEWPTALAGSFSPDYLKIPRELVITPMQEQQRYFPVYDQEGNLLNHFIALRNGNEAHLDVVRQGNEKVLQARLADAAFFWEEDKAVPLAQNAPRLASIVFHEKLGTLAEKVERVKVLAAFIADSLGYDPMEKADTLRTVELMKCDLVSKAVFEFTELQGTMGKYYALESGEKPVVAQAIEEHYMPRFSGDQLPQTKPGIAAAIADKLDSLTGFFALDMQPTGSQDPYALRRQAMGICLTLVRRQLPLDVTVLATRAYTGFQAISLPVAQEKVVTALSEFMAQRLDNILSEEGVAYDVINAVLAGDTSVLAASYQKGIALAAYRHDDEFQEMMAGFKRAANITKGKETMPVVPEALVEPQEKALYTALEAAKAKAAQALAKGDYQGVLSALASLRQPVDTFLTDLMVMAEDETVRANRIGLLQQVTAISASIGDLSCLVD